MHCDAFLTVVQWADKLFGAYDTDGSGEIDLEELTALMKNSDPEASSCVPLGG